MLNVIISIVSFILGTLNYLGGSAVSYTTAELRPRAPFLGRIKYLYDLQILISVFACLLIYDIELTKKVSKYSISQSRSHNISYGWFKSRWCCLSNVRNIFIFSRNTVYILDNQFIEEDYRLSLTLRPD